MLINPLGARRLGALKAFAVASATSTGRIRVHSFVIAAYLAAPITMLACDAQVEPNGDGGSASVGGSGGEDTGAAAVGGSDAGGAGSACEQFCEPIGNCGVEDPQCVAQCEKSTSAEGCKADWDAYTLCMVENFDAQTCSAQFHECEAEATAVGACTDSVICHFECADTANGCECANACVGFDATWTCTDGSPSTCQCFQNGEPVGTCDTSTCDTPPPAHCCMAL